jgi:flavin reductase (DIM6/NTAB) family NADH-FMN oxidoreductase RutF
MIRTGECVLNLPSVDLVGAVDRLARTTGSDPVPEAKLRRGYRSVRDKFALAGLTPVRSQAVAPARVGECAVQLEARVEAVHGLAAEDPTLRGRTVVIELRILRVHLEESILMAGDRQRIDPDKWRPLIMSFQEFYGLAPAKAHRSRLGEIPERLYRSPDIDRARVEPAVPDSSGDVDFAPVRPVLDDRRHTSC